LARHFPVGGSLFAARGKALMPGTISDDVQNPRMALAKYSYSVPVTGKYDGPTMEVVAAFRWHFRPGRVDGIADHSTLITLHALLTSLPAEGRDGEVLPRLQKSVALPGGSGGNGRLIKLPANKVQLAFLQGHCYHHRQGGPAARRVSFGVLDGPKE
jgi:hypothetical protein